MRKWTFPCPCLYIFTQVLFFFLFSSFFFFLFFCCLSFCKSCLSEHDPNFFDKFSPFFYSFLLLWKAALWSFQFVICIMNSFCSISIVCHCLFLPDIGEFLWKVLSLFSTFLYVLHHCVINWLIYDDLLLFAFLGIWWKGEQNQLSWPGRKWKGTQDRVIGWKVTRRQ